MISFKKKFVDFSDLALCLKLLEIFQVQGLENCIEYGGSSLLRCLRFFYVYFFKIIGFC